jgi:plasmid maintenance system antidote protein VapI
MNCKLFREIRLYHGLSQDEFARLLGVSRSTIQMIEAGKRKINGRIRMRLAKHFDLTPEFWETVERANKLSEANCS